jgi:hypothetical protein
MVKLPKGWRVWQPAVEQWRLNRQTDYQLRMAFSGLLCLRKRREGVSGCGSCWVCELSSDAFRAEFGHDEVTTEQGATEQGAAEETKIEADVSKTHASASGEPSSVLKRPASARTQQASALKKPASAFTQPASVPKKASVLAKPASALNKSTSVLKRSNAQFF